MDKRTKKILDKKRKDEVIRENLDLGVFVNIKEIEEDE